MNSRLSLINSELQRIDGAPPGSGLPKHKKMCLSPFLFYRGSAQIFYADVASGEIPIPAPLCDVPLTTIMGDCHTSNFGFLTEEGSHGDNVIFSPNDFDDACIGHASWDLTRFCVSLALCVDHCQGIQSGRYLSDEYITDKAVVSSKDVQKAINQFLSAYISVCELGVRTGDHYGMALDTPESLTAINKRYVKAINRAAGGKDFEIKSSLAKSADIESTELKFKTTPEKFTKVTSSDYAELTRTFAPYMDDTILDIIERNGAGTGSVNMQRYYFLVGPKDYQGKADLSLCHIVEVKQQREASPLHYFKQMSPSNDLNPAHLTAMCQRRMQRKPDLLLDEVVWKGKHWLVRSRHHARVGFDPEDIAMGNKNVTDAGFVGYAELCGKALAFAHCRGDRRSTRFEETMCQSMQSGMEYLVEVATNYSQQVILDYNLLIRLES